MSEHWANKQCMKIRRVGLLATEGVYCITTVCGITLYFRGKKISRKWDLKYFREKIFS